MLASRIDCLLNRFSANQRNGGANGPLSTRHIATRVGSVRVYDSGADLNAPKPCVICGPDGPNVVEHYGELISLLTPHLRVVCFDMPGFGFSLPQASYAHSLEPHCAAAPDGCSAVPREDAERL